MNREGFDRVHDGYDPTFRATDLVSHRYGRADERRQKLARYTAPIDPERSASNTDILFGDVPLHVAVAGTAHDAVLQLYVEFDDRDDGGEEAAVKEFLTDLVTGKDIRSAYLRDRLSELNRDYSISTGDILRQDVAGRPFSEFIDDLSQHYASDSREPREVLDREVEVDADSRRIWGRADMLVETADGREVWEEKVTGRTDIPADRHAYQASIYAWHLDAEPVLDYPVQGEQHRPDYDPVDVSDAILDDILGFGESVRHVREQQAAEIRDRTGIEQGDETLEEYRERVHRALSPAASTAVVEEATREALEAV